MIVTHIVGATAWLGEIMNPDTCVTDIRQDAKDIFKMRRQFLRKKSKNNQQSAHGNVRSLFDTLNMQIDLHKFARATSSGKPSNLYEGVLLE
jgi:hypothetical protein